MTVSSPIQALIGMIEGSPQFSGNPNAREMLECIKNNDAEKGQRIARNLCETYGVKPEDAVQQARRFFHM